MINNKIMTHWLNTTSALNFIHDCGLTFNGVKKILLDDEKFMKDYKVYIKENTDSQKDDECGLFNFFNEECGWSDEDVIEEILEKMEEEYYISYQDETSVEDSYWAIYKINRKETK